MTSLAGASDTTPRARSGAGASLAGARPSPRAAGAVTHLPPAGVDPRAHAMGVLLAAVDGCLRAMRSGDERGINAAIARMEGAARLAHAVAEPHYIPPKARREER